MIIESLVRLGRPFLASGGLPPSEVILHITDAGSQKSAGFYKNVLVVEIDKGENPPGFLLASHPLRSWTEEVIVDGGTASGSKRRQPRKRDLIDSARSIAAPFVLSTGGNPTVRQGYYPVPAYVVYQGSKPTTPNSLRAMVGNPEEVARFLQSRVNYTIGLDLNLEETDQLARAIAVGLPLPTATSEKTMALVTIVDYRTGVFVLRRCGDDLLSGHVDMGESLLYPGYRICADLSRIAENLWTAKTLEASEKGKLDDGECSFCGATGFVVSSYTKGWPLFTTTYEFPLPLELAEEELVKSIALCPRCYSALVLGANLFAKSAKTMNQNLTKELFSPTQSGMGKLEAREKRVKAIYGSCFALPVLDSFLESREAREDFVASSLSRIGSTRETRGITVQLENILGFEDGLTEAISGDHYRLTIIYYGGDWSRGAVDIKAMIHDVIPSVAREIDTICRYAGDTAVTVAGAATSSWGGKLSDSQGAYYQSRCSSLPYLLSQAYGGAYLWKCLDSVLHRGALDYRPFVRNTARRMMDFAKDLSDSERSRGLMAEVVFFVSFAEFLNQYAERVLVKGEGSIMLDWRLWIRTVESSLVSEWEPTSVEELGFVVGMLTRAFARRYFMGMGKRDFIKHRIMTFGSDMKPKDVIFKGVARFSEYDRKLSLRIPGQLREWASVATVKCLALDEMLRKGGDVFMATFWAGYELCPPGLFSKEVDRTEVTAGGEPD